MKGNSELINSQKKMKFKELKFNFKDYFIYTNQTTLSNEVYGCMGNLVNMNKKIYQHIKKKCEKELDFKEIPDNFEETGGNFT